MASTPELNTKRKELGDSMEKILDTYSENGIVQAGLHTEQRRHQSKTRRAKEAHGFGRQNYRRNSEANFHAAT